MGGISREGDKRQEREGEKAENEYVESGCQCSHGGARFSFGGTRHSISSSMRKVEWKHGCHSLRGYPCCYMCSDCFIVLPPQANLLLPCVLLSLYSVVRVTYVVQVLLFKGHTGQQLALWVKSKQKSTGVGRAHISPCQAAPHS